MFIYLQRPLREFVGCRISQKGSAIYVNLTWNRFSPTKVHTFFNLEYYIITVNKMKKKYFIGWSIFINITKNIFLIPVLKLLFALNFLARNTQKCGGMGRRKNATGSAQIKSKNQIPIKKNMHFCKFQNFCLFIHFLERKVFEKFGNNCIKKSITKPNIKCIHR